MYVDAKSMYEVYNDGRNEIEVNGSEKIKEIKSLEVRNVSFGFNKKRIIDNFSTSIEPGKIFILKGGNGKGKTTLVNLLTGIYQPSKGKIFINAISGDQIDWFDLREKKVAFMDQKDEMFYDNAFEEITGETDVAKIMENEFNRIVNTLNINKLFVPFSEYQLSGGERKKINIARIMYEVEVMGKNIIILDEPSNHLDLQTRDVLIKYLEEKVDNNHIIMMITHDKQFLGMADEEILL